MDTTRASLLIRIRDPNDRTAWGQFDEIYRPLLRRLCKARGLDDSSADDIVQQCMVKVHGHIAGFEYNPDKGHFKSWLRTMASRLIINLRERSREKSANTDVMNQDAPSEESPEEQFDKLWMEEHLAYCLESIRGEIGAASYEAFQLYVLKELPADEVSKRLGLAVSELYRIKYRVTQLLTEKMSELLDGAA
jgi:RNA polymerase sigma factor (sigma-70 family)